MSEQNVELVRAIHDRWAAGASSADLIAPDLEYVNPPYFAVSDLPLDLAPQGHKPSHLKVAKRWPAFTSHQEGGEGVLYLDHRPIPFGPAKTHASGAPIWIEGVCFEAAV